MSTEQRETRSASLQDIFHLSHYHYKRDLPVAQHDNQSNETLFGEEATSRACNYSFVVMYDLQQASDGNRGAALCTYLAL